MVQSSFSWLNVGFCMEHHKLITLFQLNPLTTPSKLINDIINIRLTIQLYNMYNARFDIVRLTAQAMDAFTIHIQSTVVQQLTNNQPTQSHLPNGHYFPITNFSFRKTSLWRPPYVSLYINAQVYSSGCPVASTKQHIS